MSIGHTPERADQPHMRAAFQVMRGRLKRKSSAPSGLRCLHVRFAPGELDEMSAAERSLLFRYCEYFGCTWGADPAVRAGQIRFHYRKV